MNTDKIHWIYVKDEFGSYFSQHEDVADLLKKYSCELQNAVSLIGFIERALKSGREQCTEVVKLITDYTKERNIYRDDSGYLYTETTIVTGPKDLTITVYMDEREEKEFDEFNF